MSTSALMDWYNEQQEKYQKYSSSKHNVKKGIKAGRIFSQNDLESARFDILANEAQWAHEEDMYNKYESPSAMVAQYQEAGLNPALMYQQGASPASVDTGGTEMSADSTTGSAAFEPMQIISSLIGMVSQGANVGSMIGDTVSQIKRRRVESTADLMNAQSAKTSSDAQMLEAQNHQKEIEQGIKESESRISLNDVKILAEQANIRVSEKQADVLSAQFDDIYSQIDQRQFDMSLAGLRYVLDREKFDFDVRQYEEVGKDKALSEIALNYAKQAREYAEQKLAEQQRQHLMTEDVLNSKRQALMEQYLNEKKREFDEKLKQEKNMFIAKQVQDGIFEAANIAADIINPARGLSNGLGKALENATTKTTTIHYDKYGRKSGSTTTTRPHSPYHFELIDR